MCKLVMEIYRWTIPRVVKKLVSLEEGRIGVNVVVTTALVG